MGKYLKISICILLVLFLIVIVPFRNLHTEMLSNEAQTNGQCLESLPSPIKISAGEFSIGMSEPNPEESSHRLMSIDSFLIDAVEVTNAQFREFVEEAGYLPDAEKTQPGFDVPGGSVFMEPSADNPNWWRFIEGASWRHPEGPDSDIIGRDNDPVVQVSFRDAQAYAEWAGRRLPTEHEWEYAAAAQQGPTGANTWQGIFPIENTEGDGYRFRAPVGCYPPNKFGLYDMIGNIWEWTSSDIDNPNASEPVHVIKGGSFLCAPNFCRRYRASARQFQEIGLPTNHIGFRTVKSLE